MNARRRPALITALLALTCLVTSASAEPIPAIYNVEVLFRQSYPTGVVERVNEQFQLRLSFDPSRSSPESGVYGPPTFSTVPLALPNAPSGLSISTGRFTQHVATLPDPGTSFTQYALARTVTTSAPRTDETQPEFFRILHLETFVQGLATPTEISATTFPAHLGITGHNSLNAFDANFVYGGYFLTGPVGPGGNYAANSFAYFGNALLVGTATPVPDPATIVLTGAGLAVIGQRRWRQRRIRQRALRVHER
jgi:hypothetical protein